MSDEEDFDLEEEEEEEDTTLNNPVVVQKYKQAATILNAALAAVVAKIEVGAKVLDICSFGDSTVLDATGKLFSRSKGEDKVERGLAFPTCVSVNNIVCHYSPLPEDTTQLAEGDVVRVDMGVHLDGYAAIAAHTVVVGKEPEDKLANAFAAAEQCAKLATHAFRPGNSNQTVTEMWQRICDAYQVTMCEGVLSHSLKRFVLDGNDVIISKSAAEQKVDDVVFEPASVWTVDLLISTGAGKLREGDSRVLVYKRAADQQFMLRTKAGRDTLNEINTKYQSFPFALRGLDSRGGRLGVAEALKHELLLPYPVLYPKNPAEQVVHFKFTVLITNTSIEKITGLPFAPVKTDKKCEDKEVAELMQRSLKLTAKKKKKKPAKKEAEAKPQE
eukprot:NODE_665_length_1280_cov_79.040763_g626_i0.p1 GENE.NODE_665_length_1280_cov_79.040763_g626_i0~~NODE_665_length_1280_cov_79.040763_g626_i0.p1  ORF type:complete len:387 (-),score=112.76 NODE_665_length_1280_cov_79.040763_g626_i0:61-1221(-)